MPKTYLDINVFDAAVDRINYAFDNFEKVYVSFSAGKDSTVMLHMVADIAEKRGVKFGVMLVDLEGQYKITIDHALTCVEMYKHLIDLHWICLPVHLRNAVSVYEPFWKCWDHDAKEAWIRQPPDCAVTAVGYYSFFEDGMEFEEFVPHFGEWYSEGKSCACLVGIRSDESLNRFRTVASESKIMHGNNKFTTKVTENVFNLYPVYDWKTSDVWTYHAKTKKPHNGLYDLMQKAGVPLGNQRICQPYGDDQRRGLWLFHLIEPETWSRIVARVNGANGGSMYMQEWGNINGYRKISKPIGHTWRSFAELLMKSMPDKTQIHYENKILLFIRWWKVKGYPEGIPDEADYRLEQARRVPSWRRVCKSLLRNDYWCKGLGFSQQKSAGYQKYLDLMKRRKEGWGNQKLEVNNESINK